MQQLMSVWSLLDVRKRIVVIAASLAMFAAVLGVSRMAASTDMNLLYAGLEASAAGDVVAALEARGVVYEIRGASIFVDAAQRDSLRMTLASEGLPANGGGGYELLDGLSGFGTTSQMFDAAYWRAKEGELARTIVSSPLIQKARVHIGNVSTQQFRQRSEPAASVAITTGNGTLGAGQVKALKYLVSSAVPGLNPERVSIIDSRGGLLGPEDTNGSLGSAIADRAQGLKQKIERLLEARVGFGKAIVEVNLDTVTEQESIVERRFDPEGRVAISTDTIETQNAAEDSADGGVTVASNLPDGDAGGAGSGSSSNANESRERINYEVSETTREIHKTPGAIKRLTVAVLVDGIRVDDAKGQSNWAPRSEQELSSLRELVAGAVGYDEARGDQITIKTMEFEQLPEVGTEPQSSVFAGFNLDLLSAAKLLVLAIVAIILGLFVVRPILLQQQKIATGGVSAPSLPELGVSDGLSDPGASQVDALLPAGGSDKTFPEPAALDGKIDGGGLAEPEMAVVSGIDFGNFPDDRADIDPVERLRELIAERQDETVEILRGWMEEEAPS